MHFHINDFEFEYIDIIIIILCLKVTMKKNMYNQNLRCIQLKKIDCQDSINFFDFLKCKTCCYFLTNWKYFNFCNIFVVVVVNISPLITQKLQIKISEKREEIGRMKNIYIYYCNISIFTRNCLNCLGFSLRDSRQTNCSRHSLNDFQLQLL